MEMGRVGIEGLRDGEVVSIALSFTVGTMADLATVVFGHKNFSCDFKRDVSIEFRFSNAHFSLSRASKTHRKEHIGTYSIPALETCCRELLMLGIMRWRPRAFQIT
jgi:hypothetical protein